MPFKREDWESEIDVTLTAEQISAKNKENALKYRKPDGGIYQREVWERRKYQQGARSTDRVRMPYDPASKTEPRGT